MPGSACHNTTHSSSVFQSIKSGRIFLDSRLQFCALNSRIHADVLGQFQDIHIGVNYPKFILYFVLVVWTDRFASRDMILCTARTSVKRFVFFGRSTLQGPSNAIIAFILSMFSSVSVDKLQNRIVF